VLPAEVAPGLRRIADELVDVGWEPRTSFEELIRLMTDADLKLLAP